MKLKLLYTATAILIANFVTAQVLWSENFDNLTVGNIGTDHTGNTPGQGGWYTFSQAFQTPTDASNDYFKIVAEPGRGKVMELSIMPSWIHNQLQKRGIDTLWNTRNSGNDILKIEYDFFTGPISNMTQNQLFYISTDNNFSNNSSIIAYVLYRPQTLTLNLQPNSYFISSQQSLVLTENTWVKFIFYVDYPNQKVYFTIPSLGVLLGYDAPNPIPPAFSLLIGHGNYAIQPPLSLYKYDNFVISAVNTVPLNIQEWVSSKFNVFPNPVNDVVTITNSENIDIEELTVYDINGKIVKYQESENADEIQLNLSELSSATYLLHIKTNKGIVVKKIIKK